MKKIMLTFGTRPEAIKMAPLINELKKDASFHVVVCVTAQHREMLDQVLNLFNIDPDIDLDLMKKGQNLSSITSSILEEISKVLEKEKPDLVLIHGDTTTTFATSLACFYAGIPIGHVEAGLRTNNMLAPFPEEFNRQAAGLLAKYHFAPTTFTKHNLLKEGKNKDSIIVTGNTVIDALHMSLGKIESNKKLFESIVSYINKAANIDILNQKIILITGHRRENFGSGFLQICNAIKKLALENQNINFVYPVHLNPRVQEPVNEILSNIKNIKLIEPLEYEKFIILLKFSYLVLTDSGGIQEEAPSLGKPVLVLRDVTERQEALENGTVMLVGSSKDKIVKNVQMLIDNQNLYDEMSNASNPYGYGDASKKIIKFLKKRI